MEIDNPSYFGTVTFEEPQTVELAPAGYAKKKVTVMCAHGEWRQPNRLAQFLPENFFVPIDCYTTADGFRRIVPRFNFEELINVAAVGGLAVIHGVHGFDKEVDHSYRAMLLIHQHVRGRTYRGTRGMKEHLTREFNYSRDLYIRRLGRPSEDGRSVLPEDIVLDPRKAGKLLPVKQLTKTGRLAAKEAGYHNPTSKQAIAFGLFVAAKLKPSEFETEQIPGLVRMALFNIDCSTHVPSEKIIDTVEERLLEAIHGHLDDSQEDFDKWFSGSDNSLVKQIAKQKLKRGGVLEREEVRQALLYLGWRAYEYVGQCVHALMRTIKNSMPDPLNEGEKRLFEHMHESQPYYGGFPAALLAERMDSIRLAVLAIWEEPHNQKYVHVLHRLMWYYADMAHKRREADRQSKQRCQDYPPTSLDGILPMAQATEEEVDANMEDTYSEEERFSMTKHYVGSTAFNEDLHTPLYDEEDLFEEVAKYICELREIECENGCVYRDYRREAESEESFIIEVRCECGNVDEEIPMSKEEFNMHKNNLLY